MEKSKTVKEIDVSRTDGVKIANPIYDTVFKHLMGNRRIAKFFVETLIGEQVDEIAVVPQEYTYKRIKVNKAKDASAVKATNVTDDKDEVFSIIRFDFVATIRTATGEHKKVLIEIQKSRKPTDLIRFRTYLGEQYKRIDVINTANGEVEKSLPIICIYLLGFKLSGHETQASHVGRISWDLISKKKITKKDAFVEALTHDAYFVQITRIKGRPRTLLGKMLSVFGQEYFIDEKNIVKKYKYPVDNDIIGEMVDVLRNVAADPEERRNIEQEWLTLKDEEGYEQALKAIEEKDKTIGEKDKALAEKDKTLAAERKARTKDKKTIHKLEDEVAELRRLLGSK
jgi:hypothetical protein